ncbi:MAG TPA: cyclophane-containing peptide 2OG-Fe(II) oxygenase YhhC [Pyrinomonadaceae bacterium]|jgi:Rps23 Pro-64 3,4-dihydroxylase Tpa1-like proline 4-hydroxylase
MMTTKQQKISFSDLEFHSEPFDYFTMSKAFEEEDSRVILDWMETSAPWKLVEADFYTQYEFDLKDASLPEELAFLSRRNFLNYLIERFGKLFSQKLSDHVDITAHKLIKGHTIRLHNDFIPNQETHRLLIQFNNDWRDENGGFLLFFRSSDPKDIERIIRPIHNSSVGFAISPKSNHAVTTIHDGERYTLVYSFYEAGSVG